MKRIALRLLSVGAVLTVSLGISFADGSMSCCTHGQQMACCTHGQKMACCRSHHHN
jgi:hypothetical protein